MRLSEKDIMKIFEESDALLRGHFRLTSGRHSDVYFQCAKVLQYAKYNEQLCSIIAEKFKDVNFDAVISPAIGGLVVGQEVARQLNKKFIFAERENFDLVLRRGFSISEDEKLLICEDVITTGGSVFEVMEIVKSNNAEIAGIGFIVDRSNGNIDFGYPQISTIKLDVKSYMPEDCPYCEEGLELVKPGSRKVITN
jgi:orotate phosphoribosyltransferase